MKKVLYRSISFIAILCAGCGSFTDPAVRIAYALEGGIANLKHEPGSMYRVQHRMPFTADECSGPYKVQLEEAGVIAIWCLDEELNELSNHSTSYHARFVRTPQTFVLEKPAGATLTIELERRDGIAVIADVK